MMSLESLLAKLRLSKSCLNSSLVLYVLFFSIYILNTQSTVLSLRVCETERDQCYCSNNKTKAVQCLLYNSTGNMTNAHKSYKLFCEVMSQFNCEIKYSVKWNCTHCLDAYTMWLLAVFAPENTWLLDCMGRSNETNHKKMLKSFCKDVMAKCPYFAPQNSYGDAPAFNCP